MIPDQGPPATPVLAVLELAALHTAAQSSRADADADLAGLVASMACEREPYLVQPPVVEAVRPGMYRVLAGARRVRGALLAGWATVACLVQPAPDPLTAHTMRLVENLHRRDLHPLDAATALKIAWLAENAAALGAAQAAWDALAQDTQPYQTLAALGTVAAEAGFTPTHPAIPWATLLGRLGLAVDRERLKKLLRVLNLGPEVVAAVRLLDLTEAALRALGTLDEPDQRRVAAALAEDPSLARKLRRVARLVRQGGYPIERALAEVRGRVYAGPAARPGHDSVDVGAKGGEPEAPHPGPDYADAALQLAELAEQFAAARAHLSEMTGGAPPEALPHPWGALVAEALALVRADSATEPTI